MNCYVIILIYYCKIDTKLYLILSEEVLSKAKTQFAVAPETGLLAFTKIWQL